MKRETKAWLIVLTPFFVGLLVGILVGSCMSRGSHREVRAAAKEDIEESQPEEVILPVIEDSEIEEIIPKNEKKDIIYDAPRPKLSKLFPTLNEEHLAAAKKYGLKETPKTRDDVNYGGLVLVTDNEYLKIMDLKYSVPYLTQHAAQELNIIGKAFHDSLANHRLLNYKLVVSSLLRTEEDVNRLRKVNGNASANSSHCYGTSFDIANQRYFREDEDSQDAKMEPFELNKVMSEVLTDRMKQGKIICKFEKNQHCFHITVCY